MTRQQQISELREIAESEPVNFQTTPRSEIAAEAGMILLRQKKELAEKAFSIIESLEAENKKLKEKVEIAKKHLEKFLAPKQFHESGFINFHCSVCGHEPKKFDDGAKEALNNLKERA